MSTWRRASRSDVRVFTLDTGRLPDETYQMMETVRQRYGIRVEVVFPEREEVEQMVSCTVPTCSTPASRTRALSARFARSGRWNVSWRTLKAWATGLRREQSETRARRRES